jgi:hypothetical protein
MAVAKKIVANWSKNIPATLQSWYNFALYEMWQEPHSVKISTDVSLFCSNQNFLERS